MAGVVVKIVTEPSASGVITHFDHRVQHADDIQVNEHGDLTVLQDGKVVQAFAPGRWEQAMRA